MGMPFDAVNTRGGVARDRASAIGLLSRFLPVGFYYKAVHGHAQLSRGSRRCIRALQRPGPHGLRSAAPAPRDRRYLHAMWR